MLEKAHDRAAASDEPATRRRNTCHSGRMSDPRNVAHDKKVTQEKKHNAATTDAQAGQPGKKAAAPTPKDDPASAAASRAEEPDDDSRPSSTGPSASPAQLEGSLVVLAQLKDLDFHSRAHLERLAALQMTIEDELKQGEVAGPLAEVYAAQSTFQTRLTSLLDLYKSLCDRLQSAGT